LSSASSITLVDSDHQDGDDEADENKPLSFTFNPPEYTWKEIYAAIPTHCLKSNTLLSLSYVARDFLYVSLLFTLATQIHNLPTPTTRFFAWGAYAFAQGLVFTGLWELAHECGHGALSPQKWINNTLGLVIHSFVLVPFHSWRITHGHHHKATNNLDRDIAFVPTLKEDYDAERKTHSRIWDMIEDMPVVTLGFLFFHQLVAFPIYLTNNNFALERMAKVPWWKRSHFYLGGDGPNFKATDTRDILKSDVGIAIALTLLWAAYVRFGAWNVFLFYGAPYLWTNHWIRKLPSSTSLPSS
jgi:omega-6 fatty acid desaturase (delta-12 desaturase)